MFSLRHRRGREAGQTLVMLALLLGIIMIIAALVIDTGSHQRIRSQTQYVCDAGALAGIAEIANSHDPVLAKQKALNVLRLNGYTVGQNDVESIIARAFNHAAWPDEDPTKIDVANSDRYEVIIRRSLPQYFANIIGFRRVMTTQKAVAALLGEVPIDTDFTSQFGFPDRANLAQFGPNAPYTFGDPYSTLRLDNGTPNPLYNPNGYSFDLFIPSDLVASTGSSVVRVELYDPDTINRGTHVVKQPSQQRDTNGDPTEPEVGGLDEIRRPPPNGNDNTSPAEFPVMSTQTEWTIFDRQGQIVARASYGPASNTPFWLHREDPATATIHTATHADPAQAQIATDLKWITPQGFQFDTAAHPGPFRMQVRTVAGSSENGYGMRLSIKRAAGQAYDPVVHGVTDSSSLAIFARGKLPINFSTTDVTKIPIGNVPAHAEQVVVTNFDTDVGSQYSKYTMSSFDTTTGQGQYPILWPTSPTASGPDIVTDTNGNKYTKVLPGTLSPNGQFRTDSLNIPQSIAVPRTDGNGNLVFDANGRVEIVDQRPFEGGQLEISYSAGAYDTSVWEVSFSGAPVPGSQQIVLIR